MNQEVYRVGTIEGETFIGLGYWLKTTELKARLWTSKKLAENA